jgi:uncharacterized membrane protein YgaE (UPF0421/DUF939 family)
VDAVHSSDRPERDEGGNALREMTLRAYDVSGRTARRGRDSLMRRLERWRSHWFLIAQTAVTAGLAWLVSVQLLGHPTPFFAPIAAIVTLGVTYGQRLRRGIEIAVGVAVGVLVGELFGMLAGSGVWQIIVVVAIAMSVATLLSTRQLIIMQACVQSVLVVALASAASEGFSRWLDAVVGCTLALLVATVAPGAPLRKPAQLAARVLDHLAATLDAAATELRDSDEQAGDKVLAQARETDDALAELNDATAEGLAVVRQSPFRRRQLPGVEAYAQLSDPLDHASRNLRVLARRCAVALWRGEEVPAPYRVQMTGLAEVMRFMAIELRNGRLPARARERLTAIGRDPSHLELAESLSAVVILAQVRSITADLLELTGMDYAEARGLIPDMD